MILDTSFLIDLLEGRQAAFEKGLEELWENLVVAQYLDGELDREEAIERVGRAKIKQDSRTGDCRRRRRVGPECVTVGPVSDTGPLIHLGEIHSLELLNAFDRLYVPETVYDELERGGVPDELGKLSFRHN